MKKQVLTGISKLVLKSATKEANSACALYVYQPKTPEVVKKLRKF